MIKRYNLGKIEFLREYYLEKHRISIQKTDAITLSLQSAETISYLQIDAKYDIL